MTTILGIHLMLLGAKAMFGGGLVDGGGPAPTLNPPQVSDYFRAIGNGKGLAAVHSLEDIVGGRVWVGLLCLGGGVWHLSDGTQSLGREGADFFGGGVPFLQFGGDRFWICAEGRHFFHYEHPALVAPQLAAFWHEQDPTIAQLPAPLAAG